VYLTSRRRILSMPSKDWRAIPTIFKSMDLEGDANNASRHLLRDRDDDEQEGPIVIPKKRNWRVVHL
jgi:hypothetical protein